MTTNQMLVQMLHGTVITLKLFCSTIIFSIPLGLCLTYLSLSKNKLIKSITGFYILIMRGTPLLLQLFFFCFGLPFIPVIGSHLILPIFFACQLAFILNYAAYFAEIFRGGLLSIDKGQYEAAKVLGISNIQTVRKIILPQMIKIVLPPVSNETIDLVKGTSLITAVAQAELLYVTKGLVNTLSSPTPYILAALLYLVLSFILTTVFKYLERKYSFE